jgi:hypothetical protein
MKRIVTKDVRVEHAELLEASRCLTLSLWLRLTSGRYFDIPIHFDAGARRHSTLYRNWTLVEHLLRCQGLMDGPGDLFCVCRRLSRCCFKLRLVEFRPGQWAIEKAKAIEPFEVDEPEAPTWEELVSLLEGGGS